MRSHSGNFRVQLRSGDRAKRCVSEGLASELDQPGQRCVETSRNVISFAFIETQQPLSRYSFNFFSVLQSFAALGWLRMTSKKRGRVNLERAVKHDRAIGRAALVVVTDLGAMEVELPIRDVAAFDR